MPKHNIYALCEPGTENARYIGQTSRSIDTRLRQHITKAHSQKFTTPVNAWIKSLDRDPDVLLLERCPASGALDAERAWIATFVDRGHDLLNVQDCAAHPRLFNGTQKTFAVPPHVHAQAERIARREHLSLWKVLANALELYENLNGSDQDGQQ